ncbi:MAG: acetate--CoA ligase family protein [Bacteroidales bacterium]
MINEKLINPASIVVVGGSDDISKPGGKVLKNLKDGNFKGALYVVNPKADQVQGVKSYRDIKDLPGVDLAIIAIPAKLCSNAVDTLAREKSTGAFIILSAGFGEENPEGKVIEKEIAEIAGSVDATLIGPNCIGFLNSNYNGVFTTPIPTLRPDGVDFISGSGATAVFIMESAIPNGLPFSSIWSVGNSAQTGVEDVLEFLDLSYVDGKSPRVKILYIENINNPAKLLKHSQSLIAKGCRIAAIKSGSSEAGSRAASSHTGALASSDIAVEALFRKAGIIRCNSRSELTAVASVCMFPKPAGKRIAVITHAGGPAVMMTDALSRGGFEIPSLSGKAADELKAKLFPGSSVANPIDFLATGTAEQLGHIIDACENQFDSIDSMAVIFGSPGLFPVSDVYKLLSEKMKTCRKPVFPVLPSIINVKKEIEEFISLGNITFPDEVIFAEALSKMMNTPSGQPVTEDGIHLNSEVIRKIISSARPGYLSPGDVSLILDSAGIARVPEAYAVSEDEAVGKAAALGYPVVMKIIGPVHKTDVGGVLVGLADMNSVREGFRHMKSLPGFEGTLLQKMVRGTEFFAGLKDEGRFGHLILAGLGGIFIEVMKDFSAGLVPVDRTTAGLMIRSLKSYPLVRGVRGKKGIDEKMLIDIICRLSALAMIAPEITEMDINPLMGSEEYVVAVDARIKISDKKAANL